MFDDKLKRDFRKAFEPVQTGFSPKELQKLWEESNFETVEEVLERQHNERIKILNERLEIEKKILRELEKQNEELLTQDHTEDRSTLH